MAQIINRGPGLGGYFGSGFNQGVSRGLEQLAQQKLKNLSLRQQEAQSTAIGDFLDALAGRQPEEQNEFEAPPQVTQQAPQQQQRPQVPFQDALKQLGARNTPLSGAEGLLQALQQVIRPPQQQTQQAAPQQIEQPEVKTPATNKSQALPQKKLSREESLQKKLNNPLITPEQRIKLESLQQQKEFHKEKLHSKEQSDIDKETKPFYDDIRKHAKAAKEGNIRLDRMDELIKEGNLSNPAFSSLLDSLSKGIFGFGIDLHYLESPDSQEFRKLSADFIKNAKDYFGSRLTDADLKSFLTTIPSLMQTDEGKLRVINNLRKFNEISLIRKRAADEIINANGGRRPRNLDQLVDDIADPLIDDIAQKFKQNLDLGTKGTKSQGSKESSTWKPPRTNALDLWLGNKY